MGIVLQTPEVMVAAPKPKSRARRVLVALAGVAMLIAAINTWVYGDFKAAVLEPMEPLHGIGSLSATACSACHAEIYAEWKRSGHARAFSDPLYQAELQHQPAPFVCQRCHTPLVEQRAEDAYWLWLVAPTVIPAMRDNLRFDAALEAEGVTCVACHQVDGRMVGPFADADAPHATFKADLRAVESCARCHQFGFQRIGKLERPIIDTVTEWGEYQRAGGDQRCADCHMPRVAARVAGQIGVEPRPSRPGTDHSLRGPFDAAFVATGVVIEDVVLSAGAGRANAELTIDNQTGHRLPTAEPERALVVKLAALDGSNAELAVDVFRAERRVDVVKLRELGEDSTLAPRERLPLALHLAALPAATQSVQLTVELWLWDPEHPAAKHAGLGPQDLVHRLWTETISVEPTQGQ